MLVLYFGIQLRYFDHLHLGYPVVFVANAFQHLPTPHISSFPRRWMLLSCLMLNGYAATSPWAQLSPLPSLINTWIRTRYLDSFVTLNAGTLYQYNAMSYNSVFPSNTSIESDSMEDNELDIESDIEGASIYESEKASEYFFDCVPSLECLDQVDHSLPSLLLRDPFDISCICLPETSVNCNYHTHRDVTLDVNPHLELAPSPKALIAATMGQVNLSYGPSSSGFPVIFDTGASLAITFEKSDFVGPIRPLFNHCLGGLANGLNIAGIGTVRWKFRSKGSILSVISSAYYVPKAKARLISPQRLFNAEKGVTGRFIVEETKTTLIFDDVGEVEVDYEDKNHLPTALAKNFVPGSVEINLAGVLSKENSNLSPS